MTIKEVLFDFGLNDKEAEVYLSLLEIGFATVSEIAQQAEQKRSTLYSTLDRLESKSLVVVNEENGVRRYQAVAPDRLEQMAIELVRASSDAEDSIRVMLPKLKSLYKGTKKKPIVQIYEGKEGLITSYEDSLIYTDEPIRVVSNATEIFKNLSKYLPTYIAKRAEVGLSMKGIHPEDYGYKQIVKSSPMDVFDEAVGIPVQMFKFTSDVAIYGNKFGYMSHTAVMTVLIESEAIADVTRSLFDLAHTHAKRIGVVNGVKVKD